ncbi:hypothetical protein L584_15730 [Pantoea agglomerans Tx10]|nr:hypothetical protein L584_15730 [Pantoea agglomerans Tx10]
MVRGEFHIKASPRHKKAFIWRTNQSIFKEMIIL